MITLKLVLLFIESGNIFNCHPELEKKKKNKAIRSQATPKKCSPKNHPQRFVLLSNNGPSKFL